METSIVGVVDNFSSFNVFGGWAKQINGSTSEPLRVRAYYEGELIGDCSINLFRHDMQQNCGFNIVLRKDVDADDIKSEKVVFSAEDRSGVEVPLRFFPSALSAFEVRCYGKKIGAASDHEVKQLLAGLTTKTSKPLLKEIARTADWFRASGETSIVGDMDKPELSLFGLRVGLKSPDGSAIVGRDGTMFVLHGANSLLEQYRKEPSAPEILELAQRWVQLFRHRRASLDKRSIRYIQFVVPEKSSITPELFPFKIEAPTALLRALSERALGDVEVAKIYFDCLVLMVESAYRSSVFRKIDSHLSAYGAALLMSQMLTRMGASVTLPTDFDSREIAGSDLGGKFTFSKMYEELAMPAKQDVATFEAGLKQVEAFKPTGDQHIGTRMVWINSTAPAPLKVVAFGNSFFERGQNATNLSWWCARCFKEFHFLWQPDLDYSYVDNVRPDVVICQSIERFLPRVPSS